MKCPKCQFENPDERKFCRECGAKLFLDCPKCAYKNLPDDRYCGECGQKLDEAVEREEAVPEAPGLRKVAHGDPVYFDLEPELEGYYLDVARSVMVGKAPAAISRVIEASQKAEQAVFETIKPGVSVRSLQEAAFSVVREAGLEKFYYFKFHGQGTMRPAYPFPSQLDFVLNTGMVFTIESILVDPNLTTGTIENPFLVTEDGAQRLVKGALEIEA